MKIRSISNRLREADDVMSGPNTNSSGLDRQRAIVFSGLVKVRAIEGDFSHVS